MEYPLGAASSLCTSGEFSYTNVSVTASRSRLWSAKLVLNCRNHRTPSEPLPRQLHWLPVVKRVDYKVALLTFKTLSCGQPHYLHSLCHPYSSGRDLRSSNTHLLSIPHSVSAFQSRAFF